jgi:hypothetical protein
MAAHSNPVNHPDFTAVLMPAVRYGEMVKLRRLYELRPDVVLGNTDLIWVGIDNGRNEAVKFLLERGAKLPLGADRLLESRRNAELTEWLVRHGTRAERLVRALGMGSYHAGLLDAVLTHYGPDRAPLCSIKGSSTACLDVLRKHGQLQPRMYIRYAQQNDIDGLSYLHKHGVPGPDPGTLGWTRVPSEAGRWCDEHGIAI